ncbi:alpha/beta hydrolase [Stappia sp.]|uniref:alpha/beta fold hydrolase n=1 Tax=Stappia sp. TaxID=1870903 RepID=UPI0025FB99CB|nr:alpha/beta hydrolase [Stappia sp.]
MIIGVGAGILVLAGVFGGLVLNAQRLGRAAEADYPPVGSFREVDGQRVHFVDLTPDGWRAGDPVVIFVHGASGNLRDPRLALEDSLADGGWRRIYVDRPGHGYSERGGDDMYRPKRQAEVIAGLLEQLGIERAVAVGHSWGGAVVAQMALVAPERVGGLVFLAPATHPWPGGVNWYYDATAAPVAGQVFAQAIAPTFASLVAPQAVKGVFEPEAAPRGYGEKIGLPLLFRPDTFRANAMDVAMLKEEVRAARPSYGRILQPAAIVTGDADTVVLPEIHSAGLARDLPNAWRVDLAGAGHMPHHTRPDEVLAEIGKVVDLVFPSAGRAVSEARADMKKAAGDPAAVSGLKDRVGPGE